jgi:hypothetical protein
MALHDELLQLAKFLANREPKHPRQVSLRRAISRPITLYSMH